MIISIEYIFCIFYKWLLYLYSNENCLSQKIFDVRNGKFYLAQDSVFPMKNIGFKLRR